MNRLLLIAGIGVALAVTPAAAMSDSECIAAWTKADANRDGFIQESEAARYFAALRVASKPVAADRMTQAVFVEHCKAGLFTTAKIDAGAPLPGANSFTEAQAMDRVIAAGFANVAGLKKDANGVWRGTAMEGTKQVTVAVDFKGNVVAVAN